MVVRISDKTQNYSKVTKLLVKPYIFQQKKYNIEYVLTILSFSNHKLKDILIGQQPYDNLEDFVKGKQK